MNTRPYLQAETTPAPWFSALTLMIVGILVLIAAPTAQAASAVESPHQAASVTSKTCSSCHLTHDQPADGSWDLGTGTVCLRCHAAIPTASPGVDPLTRHDIGPQGTIYCAACHSPHKTSASARTVDPRDRSILLPSALSGIVGADGAVYALIGSQSDSRPPAITAVRLSASGDGTSALVTWTTDERASSWVDWGPVLAGGGTSWQPPFGSVTPTQAHMVWITGLTPGTAYRYRVRSADALGNSSASADLTFTAPFPYEELGAATATTTPESLEASQAPSLSPPPASLSATSAPLPSPPASTAAASDSTLLFADEFDGPLDISTWESLTPWRTRYTSGELQYYAPENVSFADGTMRILTERRAAGGYEFASGIATSLNREKFTYGYFEVRAKLPGGKGMWPAFWLTNDSTLELDVMELLGENPTRVYMTYHRSGEQVFQQYLDGPDFSGGYHTFAMDWQPTYIRWYVDGVLRAEYTGDVPADPMWITLNTAVGGAWPQDPDTTTLLPQVYDIDYVRVYDRLSQESLGAAAAAAAGPVVWRNTHQDYLLYSVDTDRVRLAVDGRDGTRSWRAASEGWESAGPEASRPTPSAPGSAIDALQLERARTVDGGYWRTALATVDREWNWQVVRFDIGTTDVAQLRGLSLLWNGRGEPTVGYPTTVYVWESGGWRLISRREAPQDISVSLEDSSVDEAFCLSCHQGPAPEGVTVPAGMTDLGAAWQTDVHGWGTGQGFGGELNAPYARASEAVSCDTCHDPHGSKSIYHVPESVNGTQTATIASGAGLRSLCVTCHQGSLNEWHAPCVSCHQGGHWAGWVDPPVERLLPTESSDCTQCHGHSKSWTHPATCLRCHGETELRTLNAAPDQPWTYSHTF